MCSFPFSSAINPQIISFLSLVNKLGQLFVSNHHRLNLNLPAKNK